jgi:hypothetical protein
MYKRLFNTTYETIDETGQKLAFRIETAITPILDEMMEEGYSLIDVENIALSTIAIKMAELRIERNTEIIRENNLKKQKNLK